MSVENITGRDIFYLEQLEIGELKDSEKVAHIKKEDREKISTYFTNSREELFQKLSPDDFRRNISERLEQEEREERASEPDERPEETEAKHPRIVKFPAWRSGKFLPLAAAALFAVAVGFFGFFQQDEGGIPAGIERIKGMEPSLNIYRAEGEGAQLMDEREGAREYDLLQIEYNGAGEPYGMIFSIDGRGTVTLHYPESLSQAPKLETGSVLLPYSYQLDDAPDFERFFFVTSEKSFNPERILDSALRLASQENHGRTGVLQLQADFEQYSLIILKETSK